MTSDTLTHPHCWMTHGRARQCRLGHGLGWQAAPEAHSWEHASVTQTLHWWISPSRAGRGGAGLYVPQCDYRGPGCAGQCWGSCLSPEGGVGLAPFRRAALALSRAPASSASRRPRTLLSSDPESHLQLKMIAGLPRLVRMSGALGLVEPFCSAFNDLRFKFWRPSCPHLGPLTLADRSARELCG